MKKIKRKARDPNQSSISEEQEVETSASDETHTKKERTCSIEISSQQKIQKRFIQKGGNEQIRMSKEEERLKYMNREVK